MWKGEKKIEKNIRIALKLPKSPYFFHSLVKKWPEILQYCLELRKPDLRKNLDLRKIVETIDVLEQKLLDLRKIF